MDRAIDRFEKSLDLYLDGEGNFEIEAFEEILLIGLLVIAQKQILLLPVPLDSKHGNC